MPPVDDDEQLSTRLKAHLDRVSARQPSGEVEQRVLEATTRPRRSSTLTFAALLVVIGALTVALVLGVSGHEVNNVFSNVSNGLN